MKLPYILARRICPFFRVNILFTYFSIMKLPDRDTRPILALPYVCNVHCIYVLICIKVYTRNYSCYQVIMVTNQPQLWPTSRIFFHFVCFWSSTSLWACLSVGRDRQKGSLEGYSSNKGLSSLFLQYSLCRFLMKMAIFQVLYGMLHSRIFPTISPEISCV